MNKKKKKTCVDFSAGIKHQVKVIYGILTSQCMED